MATKICAISYNVLVTCDLAHLAEQEGSNYANLPVGTNGEALFYKDGDSSYRISNFVKVPADEVESHGYHYACTEKSGGKMRLVVKRGSPRVESQLPRLEKPTRQKSRAESLRSQVRSCTVVSYKLDSVQLADHSLLVNILHNGKVVQLIVHDDLAVSLLSSQG